MQKTTVIGKMGEDIACKYLLENNYTIVLRNYKKRFGEIDIIATNEDFLVFVEVKTRKNSNYGYASEFVDIKKQRKIIKTASEYLMDCEYDLQPRFDVIEVYKNTLNHIKNAFECD